MRKQEEEKKIEEIILEKLLEIEQKEKIKILYAVESGSRAWGIASLDSDYDVRFIYRRSLKDYLDLQKKEDFINWELNKTFDISGWDLSKALQQVYKSNAAIFEWSHSPIVYYISEEWNKISKEIDNYFSCKACMYHYYGNAYKNYQTLQADLLEEQINYKKYFYVLRPLLACKWIEERKCPPPVLFADLVKAVLEEDKKEIIEELISQKAKITEGMKGKQSKQLKEFNQGIFEILCYYKGLAASMQDDRTADWIPLNTLFQSSIFLPIVSSIDFPIASSIFASI